MTTGYPAEATWRERRSCQEAAITIEQGIVKERATKENQLKGAARLASPNNARNKSVTRAPRRGPGAGSYRARAERVGRGRPMHLDQIRHHDRLY